MEKVTNGITQRFKIDRKSIQGGKQLKSEKIKAIKKAIKSKTYDWKKAIESAATVIVDHPEVLLWR